MCGTREAPQVGYELGCEVVSEVGTRLGERFRRKVGSAVCSKEGVTSKEMVDGWIKRPLRAASQNDMHCSDETVGLVVESWADDSNTKAIKANDAEIPKYL